MTTIDKQPSADETEQTPMELGAWRNGYFVTWIEGQGDAPLRPFIDFKLRREELGILAQHYENAIQEIYYFWDFGSTTDSSESRYKYRAILRLKEIEQVLGEKEFAHALSKVVSDWARTWAEFEKTKQACESCRRSGGGGHAFCVAELGENVSPLAAAWPDLKREEAQAIFERRPFIGMSIGQAEVAVGCLRICYGSRQEALDELRAEHLPSEFDLQSEDQVELWKISEQPWGTEQRLLLLFAGGKLIKIKRVTKSEQQEPDFPLDVARETMAKLPQDQHQ